MIFNNHSKVGSGILEQIDLESAIDLDRVPVQILYESFVYEKTDVYEMTRHRVSAMNGVFHMVPFVQREIKVDEELLFNILEFVMGVQKQKHRHKFILFIFSKEFLMFILDAWRVMLYFSLNIKNTIYEDEYKSIRACGKLFYSEKYKLMNSIKNNGQIEFEGEKYKLITTTTESNYQL
jgi:hypothetical protein